MIHEYLSENVPFHFAISLGHMIILIENHASIDFKALDGATALTYLYSQLQTKWLNFSSKIAQL